MKMKATKRSYVIIVC